MNLQAEKKWIKSEVDKINDESLIQAFKNLLDFARKKAYNVNHSPMSLEDFFQRIDKSKEDIKKGRVKNHQKVKAVIESWRK